MRKRLNLCKTIVGIVKNSVGVVGRVKLFLLALFISVPYHNICLFPYLLWLFSCLFSGRVPRYFIFHFFQGTFLLYSYFMFHIFLAFQRLRTPIFHFSLFSGYFFVFLIHYVSYFSCFLVVAYPDISFFAFFGVHFRLSHTLCFIFSLLFSSRVPRYFIFNFSRGTRLLVHHLLWLQHTPIHRKRTSTFYFLHFSGYATQLLNLFSSPTMHKRIPCGTSLHTVSFN